MYITVINKKTRKDVPFVILSTGEVLITSRDPRDTEDICYVTLGNTFYENSLDYKGK